jgi:hypothetical protein
MIPDAREAVVRLFVVILRRVSTVEQAGSHGGFDPESLQYTPAEVADHRHLWGKQ